MQHFLTKEELNRLKSGLIAAIAIPFIDDIEDYIVESIWEYTKCIDGIDPFYNIRSKKLYDVVDQRTHIGWSVKSIQWDFYDECEFELVIQRADVYKKAASLGFEPLDANSKPNRIGAALLKHWNAKVDKDAFEQNVISKRVLILLKTKDKHHYAIFEEDIVQYAPEDLYWEWTNTSKNGLKGYRQSDNMCVYRWYPSQKQLFERFVFHRETPRISIAPIRLKKAQVVDILLPYLQSQQ